MSIYKMKKIYIMIEIFKNMEFIDFIYYPCYNIIIKDKPLENGILKIE